MQIGTGTASTQPSHFVADPDGARYEPDVLERHTPDATTAVAPSRPAERSGRIVVGVDGSEASLRALAKAVELADTLNTTVQVVTVWNYFFAYDNVVLTDWSPETDAQQILGEAVDAQFGELRPTWLSTASVEGSAAQRLIDESDGAEMLVVGSRGHGGVAGVLLGSVSALCAEKAHCPVLVVH